MKIGNLYRIKQGCSLYRDEGDINYYYWSGLTPNHKNGHIHKDNIVILIKTIVVDHVGEMCEILHDGQLYLTFACEFEEL